MSGFEIATLEIESLSATDLGQHGEKHISLILETESDHFTISASGEDQDAGRSSLTLAREDSHPPSSPASIKTNTLTEVDWEIRRPIRLAVEYRHSCSLLISFVTRSSVLKKKCVIGLATIRLDECPDGEESHRTVPIFATAVVTEAMRASANFPARSDVNKSPLSSTPVDDPKHIGFVKLAFVVHPGVSRVHRKICKRDLRFKHVYEAWEATKKLNHGGGSTSVGETIRSGKLRALNGNDEEGSDESSSEEDDEKQSQYVEGEGERAPGVMPGQAMIEDQDREDKMEMEPERHAHAHALHKQVGRCFQIILYLCRALGYSTMARRAVGVPECFA